MEGKNCQNPKYNDKYAIKCTKINIENWRGHLYIYIWLHLFYLCNNSSIYLFSNLIFLFIYWRPVESGQSAAPTPLMSITI